MNKGRQGARQDVLLLTGSDIVEGSLFAEPDYIVSPDSLEAWYRDRNQQFIHPNKKGHYIQIISDVHKKPLKIFTSKPVVADGDTEVIAYEKQEEALSVMDSRRLKNHLLIWVGIVAGILALTLAIAVLLKMKNNAGPDVAMIPVITTIVTQASGKNKPNTITEKDDLKDLSKNDIPTKNCIIIPDKTGVARFNIEVPVGMIPADSNERNYKGRPTHLLALDDKDVLTAIEPQEKKDAADSPKSLFNTLQCEKEVEETYWIGESVMEKIKIGLLVLICVALIGVIFLIAATSTGNQLAALISLAKLV